MRPRLPVLAALLILGPPGDRSRLAIQSHETGRIEGVASIATSLSAPRSRVRVYDEPGTPPAKPHRDAYPLANVVLYLESTPALRQVTRAATSNRAPELRQRGERFVPHVLAVRTGTTVQFPNDDPLFHNVFSLSRVKTFDLGRYPKGATRPVTFESAGVVPVFCHIHADMSAYILVLDHPFFVIPDSVGHFVLDGVPPGDYQLVAWHERIRPFTVPVHVDAGHTTPFDIRLPFADKPGDH
jgi:plastocyanin